MPVAGREISQVPTRLVAWIGGVGALSPTRVLGYTMRTYSGRPRSSIRFSTSAAIATSLACRPSVWKRSPSPMTRCQREISDSTRARQLYPDTLCQPMRPRSAMYRRCRVRAWRHHDGRIGMAYRDLGVAGDGRHRPLDQVEQGTDLGAPCCTD